MWPDSVTLSLVRKCSLYPIIHLHIEWQRASNGGPFEALAPTGTPIPIGAFHLFVCLYFKNTGYFNPDYSSRQTKTRWNSNLIPFQRVLRFHPLGENHRSSLLWYFVSEKQTKYSKIGASKIMTQKVLPSNPLVAVSDNGAPITSDGGNV